MRRVLVTGGTRGIGKAISIAFKEAGYNVMAIYGSNNTAAKQLEEEHGIKTFKCDVSDFDNCRKAVPSIEEKLGGNIEVLINNAGITRDAMLHKQTYENWKAVIDTNLSSVFNMCYAVIGDMRENSFGRIINVSSMNANGMAGQTNYSAAKAGVEGFTKALALESAPKGITVNAIAPGYTNTEMVARIPQEVLEKVIEKIPLKRLGEAEEIAHAALFLASEKSGFLIGAVIPVNGGLRV